MQIRISKSTVFKSVAQTVYNNCSCHDDDNSSCTNQIFLSQYTFKVTSNDNWYNIFDDQLEQVDAENNPIQFAERT